jgi:ubiquinone/menaquinone biosynthesis C-methylase UbiE
MNDPFNQKRHRDQGSTEYFRRFWQHATAQDYAYPRVIPTTQWDLYEREKARLVMRFLQQAAKHTGYVLECGCGSAGMSVYLANQGYQVLATDISGEALHIARDNWMANASKTAAAPFTLAIADALHLPFTDAVFDVVMSYGLLEHFEERALASSLQQMHRVLKPGGILLGDIVHNGFLLVKWLYG